MPNSPVNALTPFLTLARALWHGVPLDSVVDAIRGDNQ